MSVEQYKVVVVGDGGVGKTAITIQLVHNHFLQDYDPTIESSYKKMLSLDGDAVALDILDTAGQEEYRAMRDQHYRTGHGFIFVYAVNDRASFVTIPQQRAAVLRVHNSDEFPMVFVANKIDLVEERDVTHAEGQQLARSFGVPYVEVSAKTRTNIEECFSSLVREIRRHRKREATANPECKGEYRRKNKSKRSACLIL
eukprot:m51a1_g2403 putative ras gtpase (199) ;mRNA; f:766910-768049